MDNPTKEEEGAGVRNNSSEALGVDPVAVMEGGDPDVALAAELERLQLPFVLGVAAAFAATGFAVGLRYQTKKHGRVTGVAVAAAGGVVKPRLAAIPRRGGAVHTRTAAASPSPNSAASPSASPVAPLYAPSEREVASQVRRGLLPGGRPVAQVLRAPLSAEEKAVRLARAMPDDFDVYRFAGRAMLLGTGLCVAGAAVVVGAVRYVGGFRSFREFGDWIRGGPVTHAPQVPAENPSVFDSRFWLGGGEDARQQEPDNKDDGPTPVAE
jgi:hypothetical protein